MRIFLLIVFLILTGLYAFQLWSTYRPVPPPAQSETNSSAAVPGAAPALAPSPPEFTPQRLALEKALSGIRISSLIGGAVPLAQIAGQSYQVGDTIVVPGSEEPVTVRLIGDGFVIYGTPYHPEGFRADLSREQIRAEPPAN